MVNVKSLENRLNSGPVMVILTAFALSTDIGFCIKVSLVLGERFCFSHN